MNKNNFKVSVLLFGIFGLGMFSVPISNIFGGYYSFVAGSIVVMATLLVFNVLDQGLFKENKINLALVAGMSFFEILFFVVNDIIGYNVYNVQNLNFWGLSVLGSQLYATLVVIYLLITTVLQMYSSKGSAEIIEPINDFEEPRNDDEEIANYDDSSIKNDVVEEIKSIPQNTIVKDAPFMDEEK